MLDRLEGWGHVTDAVSLDTSGGIVLRGAMVQELSEGFSRDPGRLPGLRQEGERGLARRQRPMHRDSSLGGGVLGLEVSQQVDQGEHLRVS